MKNYDVIVTGSSGFVGQSLIKSLIQSGFNVLGIDVKKSEINFPQITHDLTKNLDASFRAETFVHLASSVGGIIHNSSLKAGIETYNEAIDSNTLRLFEKTNAKNMIFTSSINVFENQQEFLDEALHIYASKTPYAISKMRSEQFFLSSPSIKNLTILRPTNIFGKNQHRSEGAYGESHVIPDLIQKILSSDTIEVFGDGTQIRNFVHVSDITEFIIKNIKLQGANFFNLRSEITIQIKELAEILRNMYSPNVKLNFNKEYMRYETFVLKNFDISHSKSYGWDPVVKSIEIGLQT